MAAVDRRKLGKEGLLPSWLRMAPNRAGYALRDEEGKFVARARNKASAYRASRTKKHLGASVNVGSVVELNRAGRVTKRTKSSFEQVDAEIYAMPHYQSNYQDRREMQKILRRHGWGKWEYEAAVEERRG